MPGQSEDLSKEEVLRLFKKSFSASERRQELRKSLRKSELTNLYEVARFLREDTRRELGVYLENVYAYVQDPLVAERVPAAGIQPIGVGWEPGLADGPTSARLAVVDYNADTGVLTPPAHWNTRKRRFEGPDGQPLGPGQSGLFQFHQVNAWVVIQHVIDMYESPFALGRPIPWGTGGNRLIIVPHAGYGENAYYDRHSKSLQFFYYGTDDAPKYTCLSHDIITHETGHALLDGIRPLYFQFTSVETAAFHEFVADLTAILVALRNNDVRSVAALQTGGDLSRQSVISGLAEEFGESVVGLPALRDANNSLTMDDVKGSRSPHHCSQVLTGAMYEILIAIANNYLAEQSEGTRKVSPAQALWWATQRFGRIALQPLDLCPPMDIRFIDYARAVLHNFEVYEPAASPRRAFYGDLIRCVFHSRKICHTCPEGCVADPCSLEMRDLPSRWRVYHDIDDIARSRTGAYYFLNDNRNSLGIPPNQDITVADLYDTSKYGRAASRLPREVVLQYVWREEFELEGSGFGPLQSQTAELLCGGTLVLDGRGNVLSWTHKPGRELDSDGEEGAERLEQLRTHIADQVRGGMVGMRGEAEAEVFGHWTPPVVADARSGTLRLEIAPHLRNTFRTEQGGSARTERDSEDAVWRWGGDEWTISF